MKTSCDVVVIGAGVAGLAAVERLTRAGKDVRCLEATDRAGGRILTVHDPLSPVPVELGAEFVHGRPPEIWDLIRTAGLTAYEHVSEALFMDRGRVLDENEPGEVAERILSRMVKPDRRKDVSFEDYLRRSREPAEAKNWARTYVEGFNAARKELISVASLKQDAEASEKVEGDRVFRILTGYDSIAAALLRSVRDHQSIFHFNSVVTRIQWRQGAAEVHCKSTLDNTEAALRCQKLILTVPLGVLKAFPPSPGAIHFDPEPKSNLHAARSLQFGQAYRITFLFRDAFWETNGKLKGAGFLISREKVFPTWWTTHPIISPVLTGWTAGSAADRLEGLDRPAMVGEALTSLARILKQKVPEPEAVYFHDWHADPFFRGAYSYVPAGGLPARETLAKPLAGTLFFAGEATNLTGHGSTVHGAIESGFRAAGQVAASK